MSKEQVFDRDLPSDDIYRDDSTPIEQPLTAHPLDTAMKFVEEWRKTASPDVIFVSSGSLQDTPIPRPTRFHDRDTKGNLAWGKSRAIAAATLTTIFPDARVVTLSRSSYEDPGPSDAAGMTREIRTILNHAIPITEFPMPRDTFSELLEVFHASLDNNWQSPVFVTTVFQEPRARVMLQSIIDNGNPAEGKKIEQMMAYNERRYGSIPGFTDHFRNALYAITSHPDQVRQVTVDLIPAEATFLMRSPRYTGVTDALRKDAYYNEQIQKNMDGMKQWQRGIYGKLETR